MEIKIHCDCGQKIKFDAEPVNGRMPWEVTCPVCGASGTAKANHVIAQLSQSSPLAPIGSVSSAPPAPAPIRIVPQIISTPAQVPAPAPVPIPVPIPMPASQPAAPPRLSISRPATPAPVPAPMAAPPFSRPVARAAATAEADDQVKPNFMLSLTGIFLGALLGAILWHVLYRVTGWWGIGFMAIVTGVAAGVAPQIMGHSKGVGLGVIASVIALVAIIGAQYSNGLLDIKELREMDAGDTSTYYNDSVKEAKRTVEAVPNGTDQEIRAFLAKESGGESVVVKPEEIDGEEVMDMQKELPKLRELAAGKISKDQFAKEQEEESGDAGFYTFWLLFRTFNIFNIVNICIGVGAAFMTAKG